MISVKKKEFIVFSDGSIVTNKIFIKNSNRTRILEKDHKTLNKKNKTVKKHDIRSFKDKYFKYLKKTMYLRTDLFDHGAKVLGVLGKVYVINVNDK